MKDDKTLKALRLLNATGAALMGEAMIDSLIAAIRPAARPMPDEWWREFRRRFDAEELVRLIAPRYAELIPTDDMGALIAFFESPVGRRYVAVSPRLSQESLEIGRAWGERVGAQIGAELDERR